MCGRYTILTEEEYSEMRAIVEEINRRHAGSDLHARLREGEIRPTDVAPVLVAGRVGTPCATLLPWGYPKWQSGGVIINARSETAPQRPMFRRSFSNSRCVIPTCGFFEWRHERGKITKEKYRFTLPGAPVLYLAGLYDEFRKPDAPLIRSFVILTTAPNESIREYHNRMPLVLDRADIPGWLTDEGFAREHLQAPCTAALVATGT